MGNILGQLLNLDWLRAAFLPPPAPPRRLPSSDPESETPAGLPSSPSRERDPIAAVRTVLAEAGRETELDMKAVPLEDVYVSLRDYLSSHRLFDPGNVSVVFCDETLKELFKGREVMHVSEMRPFIRNLLLPDSPRKPAKKKPSPNLPKLIDILVTPISRARSLLELGDQTPRDVTAYTLLEQLEIYVHQRGLPTVVNGDDDDLFVVCKGDANLSGLLSMGAFHLERDWHLLLRRLCSRMKWKHGSDVSEERRLPPEAEGLPCQEAPSASGSAFKEVVYVDIGAIDCIPDGIAGQKRPLRTNPSYAVPRFLRLRDDARSCGLFIVSGRDGGGNALQGLAEGHRLVEYLREDEVDVAVERLADSEDVFLVVAYPDGVEYRPVLPETPPPPSLNSLWSLDDSLDSDAPLSDSESFPDPESRKTRVKNYLRSAARTFSPRPCLVLVQEDEARWLHEAVREENMVLVTTEGRGIFNGLRRFNASQIGGFWGELRGEDNGGVGTTSSFRTKRVKSLNGGDDEEEGEPLYVTFFQGF